MIQNVDFKGIVRGTSAQNSADGNCEEIINLRNRLGAWRVVGEKKKIVEDVEYEHVFLHEYADFKNYIGVKRSKLVAQASDTSPYVYGKIIWFDPTTKEKKQEIYEFEGDVQLEQLNNVLLIRDDKGIHTCIFKDNRYTVSVSDYPELPDISQLYYSDEKNYSFESDVFRVDYKDQKYREKFVQDAIIAEYNRFWGQKQEKKFLEGYAFVRMSYGLYDGTEVMHTPPKVIKFGEDTLLVKSVGSASGSDAYMDMQFTKLSMAEKAHLQLTLSEKLEEQLKTTYKDYIKCVNIYCSKLMSYVEMEKLKVKLIAAATHEFSNYKRPISDYFDSLMYYRIKSIDITDLNGKEIDLDYDTMNNITANADMPVDDNSRISRNGNMFVYNKRLHLFNITNTIKPFNKWGYYINREGGGTSIECNIQFVLNDGKRILPILSELTTYVKIIEENGRRYFEITLPQIVAYPDSRITEMRIIGKNYHDQESGKLYIYKSLNLKASTKYNFSYYVSQEGTIREEYDFGMPEIDELGHKVFYNNSSQIIASEQSNATVFPVEHSYTVDGNIINMAVSSEQISQSQIGQYPLYVFTTQGIFAMQLGEGNVLYSNLIPISAEVAVPGSSVLQTRYGIVFVTKTGLKIISGREVLDISEPIRGEVNKNIQEEKSYKFYIKHEKLCDVDKYISRNDFVDYIKEAVMGYDLTENEIIVSNPNYNYSYVYNLDSKTWHKITEVFTSFNRHFALRKHEENRDIRDLCDIREEVPCLRTVMLQTRPLCLGTFSFKSLYHTAFRGDFNPNPNKNFGFYVEATNDLSQYACVSMNQIIKPAPIVFLNRASQSAKYFVLMMIGEALPGHLLTHAELEGEVKYDNRLR
ncbi:hypothetical protein [Dysgonomonas capnocytophagoides]|uniref:hypothetical protein n=1 Tax=Dysgonomonas capnocytophagoides TaxID=45254 RepID=UPI002A807CBB|nr:hypothetical protein [Dysgonomonas capnocytophagoides]